MLPNVIPIPTTDLQPLIRPYCDSSFQLINSTLNAMKKIDPLPDFILVLGDTIGHSTSSILQSDQEYNRTLIFELVKQTYSEVFQLISNTFPSVQVIPMIGNNDAYADYVMPIGWDKDNYLDFLYTLWQPLAQSISQSFFNGGYYITTTMNGFHVIVLNSIYFAKEGENSVSGDVQMLWLKQSLLKLSENIVIVMHITSGTGAYNKGYSTWLPRYNQAFINLVILNQDKIHAIYAGHFHTGSFQLINDLPVVLLPSISPYFGNNPMFRYYVPEENNYYEYTLNGYTGVNLWNQSDFISDYGYSINYPQVYQDLTTKKITVLEYLTRMTGLEGNPSFNQVCVIPLGSACTSENEALSVLLCTMKNPIWEDFKNCLNPN